MLIFCNKAICHDHLIAHSLYKALPVGFLGSGALLSYTYKFDSLEDYCSQMSASCRKHETLALYFA